MLWRRPFWTSGVGEKLRAHLGRWQILCHSTQYMFLTLGGSIVMKVIVGDGLSQLVRWAKLLLLLLLLLGES